ncbi:MAG: ABC transporter permease [Dehalococcoidia bacterium]
MNALLSTFHLMNRGLREAMRQPGVELTNIFIPMFFFAVTVGAIGSVAGMAFGVDNFLAFQMPVAILQAVAGTSGSAGLGTVTDIERGYFDKLLLTPAPRISLLLGRLSADAVRAMGLTVLILLAGLAAGSGMEAGIIGIAAILVLTGLFGLAYSAIGMAIALRTGSPQAAQLSFLIFFPLLFLSPAFAPKEIFAGWLEFLATINPVTYILQGMRHLILEGWSWGSFAGALGSILGLGAFTMTMSFAALRWRTS